MSTVRSKSKRTAGEPAWELARLFPAQGAWSEADYSELPDHGRVELAGGFIEVLPMPTMSHQQIILALLQALIAFAKPRKLGTALFSGLRVRLWEGQIREPDVVFMLAKHAERMGEQYWDGADLVMEVVSGSDEDRERDLVTKRAEYAQHIPEYWTVDPQEGTITVLRLSGKKYMVHGDHGRGDAARSALLKGFAVNVDEVLAVD